MHCGKLFYMLDPQAIPFGVAALQRTEKLPFIIIESVPQENRQTSLNCGQFFERDLTISHADELLVVCRSDVHQAGLKQLTHRPIVPRQVDNERATDFRRETDALQ